MTKLLMTEILITLALFTTGAGGCAFEEDGEPLDDELADDPGDDLEEEFVVQQPAGDGRVSVRFCRSWRGSGQLLWAEIENPGDGHDRREVRNYDPGLYCSPWLSGAEGRGWLKRYEWLNSTGSHHVAREMSCFAGEGCRCVWNCN